MRTSLCCLLWVGTLLVPLNLPAEEAPEALQQQIRLKTDALLRQAQIEVLLDHYRSLVRQAAQTELEAEMARLKLEDTSPAENEQMLGPLERRLQLLRQRSQEVEARIRELVAAQWKAEREGESLQPDHVQHWVGRAVGGKQLALDLRLKGREGRFVLKGVEGRMAGKVKIRGQECDFSIEEASPGLGKHVGQTLLGRWSEKKGRVGLVVSEPGGPRPMKLERSPGTVAFLLESD